MDMSNSWLWKKKEQLSDYDKVWLDLPDMSPTLDTEGNFPK